MRNKAQSSLQVLLAGLVLLLIVFAVSSQLAEEPLEDGKETTTTFLETTTTIKETTTTTMPSLSTAKTITIGGWQ
jgi:hypothetical protein